MTIEIKNLKHTSLAAIVDCLSNAFQNYFVKMPTDVEFWSKRFQAARVDFSLSYGVFENDKLVAFIIHGVDQHNGQKTAFNTGTGVLKEFRGQHLVDEMYAHAFPILKENNIEKVMLEVIDKNQRAINVYERIGFQKDRFVKCFRGDLNSSNISIQIDEINLMDIKESIIDVQHHYSWDNSLDAITIGGDMFKSFLVKSINENSLGYFVVNVQNKSLIQIESFDNNNWSQLVGAVKQIIPSIKMNNVDSKRLDLLNALENSGLINHINQYEMGLTDLFMKK